MQTVSILGTVYTIAVKKYDEDEAFARCSINGYCDSLTRRIVICEMSTCRGWEYELPAALEEVQKETLRHEIVHAFLDESGLADCSYKMDGPWAENEEMVDWIALQGPKLYAAWQEAGCL